MASRKEVESVVRALYAARDRGDFDAMVEMCAPHATLHIPGDKNLCPIAGTIKGRAALRAAFPELAKFAFTNQEMASIAVDGDTVVVHWRMTVTFNNKSAATEFCDLWTVRNGQIDAAVQFIDTALVAEMMK